MQKSFLKGKDVQENLMHIFLNADLEFFLEPYLSIRSDILIFKAINQPISLFDEKMLALIGASYHFPTGNFDPFLGVQSGIAASKARFKALDSNFLETSKRAFNPVISLMGGMNLYVGKALHFFAAIRYVYGKHMSNAPTSVSLSETSLSLGMGWNFKFAMR